MKNYVKTILRKILLTTIFTCTLFLVLSSQIAFAEEESRWDELLKISDIKQVEVTDKNKSEIVKLEKKDISMRDDVQAFAVSENRIIIVFDNMQAYTLGVFDKNMKMLNSFEMTTDSRTCSVVVKGENIVVFRDLCGYATELTPDGDFVCLYRIPKEDDSMVYEFTSNAVQIQMGSVYYMSDNKKQQDPNEGVSFHPPYLMKQDENGNKTVLYDCSIYHNIRVALLILLIVAFLSAIAAALIWLYRKELKAFIKSEFPGKDKAGAIEARKRYKLGEYVYRESFLEEDEERVTKQTAMTARHK